MDSNSNNSGAMVEDELEESDFSTISSIGMSQKQMAEKIQKIESEFLAMKNENCSMQIGWKMCEKFDDLKKGLDGMKKKLDELPSKEENGIKDKEIANLKEELSKKERELEEKKKENAKMQEEITNMMKKLKEIKTENDGLNEEIKKLKEDNKILKDEITKKSQEINGMQNAIEKLNTENDKKTRAIDELNKEVGKLKDIVLGGQVKEENKNLPEKIKELAKKTGMAIFRGMTYSAGPVPKYHQKQQLTPAAIFQHRYPKKMGTSKMNSIMAIFVNRKLDIIEEGIKNGEEIGEKQEEVKLNNIEEENHQQKENEFQQVLPNSTTVSVNSFTPSPRYRPAKNSVQQPSIIETFIQNIQNGQNDANFPFFPSLALSFGLSSLTSPFLQFSGINISSMLDNQLNWQPSMLNPKNFLSNKTREQHQTSLAPISTPKMEENDFAENVGRRLVKADTLEENNKVANGAIESTNSHASIGATLSKQQQIIVAKHPTYHIQLFDKSNKPFVSFNLNFEDPIDLPREGHFTDFRLVKNKLEI